MEVLEHDSEEATLEYLKALLRFLNNFNHYSTHNNNISIVVINVFRIM